MKKILNSFALIILSTILLACTNQKNEIMTNTTSLKSEQVFGKISLIKELPYFKDNILMVSLYEYNPRIADAPATLIYLKKFEVNHTKDSSTFPINIEVANNKTFKDNRQYYLVARVYDKNNKQKLHGYEDGTKGFIRVLNNKMNINIVLK